MLTDEDRALLRAVGHRIRSVRQSRNMTQEGLAGAVGKTQNDISRYERGGHAMPITEIVKIAEVLDVSVSYLCDGIPFETDFHNPLSSSEVPELVRRNIASNPRDFIKSLKYKINHETQSEAQKVGKWQLLEGADRHNYRVEIYDNLLRMIAALLAEVASTNSLASLTSMQDQLRKLLRETTTDIID